jgi:hypothetical protein
MSYTVNRPTVFAKFLLGAGVPTWGRFVNVYIAVNFSTLIKSTYVNIILLTYPSTILCTIKSAFRSLRG